MEDEEKKEKVFSYSKLENRSYRYLQQLAKSLELPANFKKMYLIELILAKKFKTQVEVDSIIQRVKIERLQVVSARKEWLRRKQNIDKINKSSPPITTTPKRFTYSPEMRTVLTYNSKRSLVRNNENKSSSDRVLRSFDIKTLKPNYAVMNISEDKNTVPKEAKIKIITNGGFPQINLTAKCVVTRHKPSILSSSGLKRPLMLTQTSDSLQPSKRKRALSGIYPILQESVPRNITTDNVCLRKVDGSLTKINALVQKRNMNVIPIQKNNYINQEINIQDIMNGFDGGDDQNYLQIKYPNMSSLETNNTAQMPTESYNMNVPDLYSVYYHKKIRAEQIRCQKIREMPESQRLPNINDVFSQFNHINRKDFSMPLYVQVSTESERSQSYAYHVPPNNSNTIMLETYFNFKNQQITNTPLLQIATTSNTKCVYSTPLISTAMAHPSTVVSEACTSVSHRYDDMYEFLQFTESTLRRYSDEGPSTPSSQCSQDVSTCSIPEMVEDAMDIIRRDGNYMQQIETERMQCALCACVATRGSIEAHVRRDHSNQILPPGSDRVSFRLTAAGEPWTSAALERGGKIYVLSLRHLRDCLEGTLASLSPQPEQKLGTITVYNKLTGEPFAWNGPIPPLPPNMPYENGTSCIKISLSKLDLFPNSANLKLIDRELVTDLPTKVVVGQTLVNDIDIDVFFLQIIKTFLHTMSQFVQPYQPPRQKIPKDGPGPRGVPECYYTSRVLNSTFRYVKFVRKLRAEEDDQRKGAENKLKELKDKQNSDFFIRCDRRSLINNVARRVDLCLASYQQDLKQKQKRLIDLYAHEEESNIRKFVVQAQAGAEAVWKDKMARLQYLIDKRKKEHEEKYKDTPLSRCVHVLPCIYKLRAKETEEIQLYQIKEKQARKMAEIEFDKMWHEVAMKESDALAARMEVDVIERLRRDLECKDSTDNQLQQRKIQKEKERELLKEEAKRFKAIWDEDIRKEQEAVNKAADKRMATAMERKQMIEDRKRVLEEAARAQSLVTDTWDALTAQGQTDIQERERLRRRKERELDICNKSLLELKKQYLDLENINEGPLAEEARKRQEYIDMKRCEYLAWAQKTNRDVRKAMIDQIKDREEAREKLKQKIQEQDEYHKQLFGQLEQLVDHKQITDAQKRKEHQKNLLEQIEYNKMLKERARQEELDEIKKCQAASEEYQEEIKRMLCRPFFSDEVHPFMKQMAKGLSMKEKCPCSKPDYCK